MSFTPSLEDAIESFVQSELAEVNTCMPGMVVSYDSATQQAEVLPLIKHKVETEDGFELVERPVIPGVPVIFPGAGPYKITWPISKGDLVQLQFCQESMDNWLQRGESTDPEDDRRFDMSDAVAIPGLLSFNQATDQVSDDAMVLSGDEFRIGSKDASELVALKSDLDNLYTAITTAVVGAADGGTTYKANMKLILDTASFPVGSTKVKVE